MPLGLQTPTNIDLRSPGEIADECKRVAKQAGPITGAVVGAVVGTAVAFIIPRAIAWFQDVSQSDTVDLDVEPRDD